MVQYFCPYSGCCNPAIFFKKDLTYFKAVLWNLFLLSHVKLNSVLLFTYYFCLFLIWFDHYTAVPPFWKWVPGIKTHYDHVFFFFIIQSISVFQHLTMPLCKNLRPKRIRLKLFFHILFLVYFGKVCISLHSKIILWQNAKKGKTEMTKLQKKRLKATVLHPCYCVGCLFIKGKLNEETNPTKPITPCVSPALKCSSCLETGRTSVFTFLHLYVKASEKLYGIFC